MSVHVCVLHNYIIIYIYIFLFIDIKTNKWGIHGYTVPLYPPCLIIFPTSALAPAVPLSRCV